MTVATEKSPNLLEVQKAILNILEDSIEDKINLEQVQKAAINILEDFSTEKSMFEMTQRATLNILDDFEAERNKVIQAHKELEKLNQEVLRYNKELEAFAYSVSHDLRTPLRAIDGFSKMLLEDYSDKINDEGIRLLGIVRNNTKKMAQLIDDLLSFSRVGRKEMSVVPINMEQLVKAVWEELKITIDNLQKVNFIVNNLPDTKGDASMIKQVLINLLGNALKYSHHKENIEIKIGGETKNEENIYYVKDNGAGFEMQYVHKLFGIFQRLHSQEEFEGTGVGLALVQRIVHHHNGKVWAEGKVGEGAVFYFTLPSR